MSPKRNSGSARHCPETNSPDSESDQERRPRQEIDRESRRVVPPRMRREQRRGPREALDRVMPEEHAEELAIGRGVGPEEPRQRHRRDDDRNEDPRRDRHARLLDDEPHNCRRPDQRECDRSLEQYRNRCRESGHEMIAPRYRGRASASEVEREKRCRHRASQRNVDSRRSRDSGEMVRRGQHERRDEGRRRSSFVLEKREHEQHTEQARERGRQSRDPLIDMAAVEPANSRDRPVIPRRLLKIGAAVEQHRQTPLAGVEHPLSVLGQRAPRGCCRARDARVARRREQRRRRTASREWQGGEVRSARSRHETECARLPSRGHPT